ncbi:AAA family ATPase [Mycobacterium barrassiae]|uniref:AAA family ATPase n=1 Tax=Mycobacterium barrassiae TaxID=319709 RepID=UPI0022658D93|nr:AAA family ATPase [Mycobacterium barrassiae]MCV7302631.1 AAA family ATPase [Mycobacterium barrassiae]
MTGPKHTPSDAGDALPQRLDKRATRLWCAHAAELINVATDRRAALASMTKHVMPVKVLLDRNLISDSEIPTTDTAAEWASRNGVGDPAMAGPSANARDSWTALALDHGVAPLAEFSLSSIVAAGDSGIVGDWATNLVEHARNSLAVQRPRRPADRAVKFTASRLVWEFNVPVSDVLLLPVATTASDAATAHLVDRWEAEDWRAARSGDADSDRPHVRRARSLVPAAQLDWLARGRVPTAAVTLLVGDEGIGKSLYWVWLAGAVTTGKAVLEYGIPARDPGHVFVVATEDDWATAVLPRLEVAGVDLDYVHVVCVEEDGSGAPTFPRDIGVLADAEVTPALVVVDAWLDTVPSGLQVRDPQQARQALHPWREYAASTRASVLLLTHTNRVATANPRDKYGITSELRKKARSTLFAQADPDNPECVLIGPEKSNIAGQTSSDRFRITPVQHFEPTDSSDGTVPRIEYVESVGRSARELITDAFYGPGEDDDDSDVTEARNWLDDFLTAHGRTPSKDVKSAARADGITERTLQRAAEKMKRAGDLAYFSEGFPRVTAWELVGGLAVDGTDPYSNLCERGEQ